MITSGRLIFPFRRASVRGLETASVFISAAAFLLAIASLYLTSLRRTKIEVDHLEDHPQFHVSTFEAHMPHDVLVGPPVFIWNSGAHSGVLQTFECSGFRCIGSALFDERIERPTLKRQQDAMSPSTRPPWPVDANDGDTYFIAYVPRRARDIPDAETYARRLANLEAIELNVSWSYRRPKLLRGRKTVTKRQTITIDGTDLRAVIRHNWAANRPDLLELLPVDAR